LDSDVIAWLKADGRGYQTKANWLLRSTMEHFRKEASLGRRKAVARRVNVRGRKHDARTDFLLESAEIDFTCAGDGEV
jgi:BrnA antitoxin of type II toxin-antitoxin system